MTGLAVNVDTGEGPTLTSDEKTMLLAAMQVRGDLNRLLEIEEEIGSSARFLGRASFKTGPARH